MYSYDQKYLNIDTVLRILLLQMTDWMWAESLDLYTSEFI